MYPTPGHAHHPAGFPTDVLTAVVSGQISVAPGQTAHHVPDLVGSPQREDGQLDVESPPYIWLVDGEGERVRVVGPEVNHLLVPDTALQWPGAAQPPLAPPSEAVTAATLGQQGLTCAGLEQDLQWPLVGLPAQHLRVDRVHQHRALGEHLVPAAHQVDADGEGEGAAGQVGHPHEGLRGSHSIQGQTAVVWGQAGTGDVGGGGGGEGEGTGSQQDGAASSPLTLTDPDLGSPGVSRHSKPEGLPGGDTEQRPDVLVVVEARHDGHHVLLSPVDGLGSHQHVLVLADVVCGQHGVVGPGGGAGEADWPVAVLQADLGLVGQERQHLPGQPAAVSAHHRVGSAPQPTEIFLVKIFLLFYYFNWHLDISLADRGDVGEEGEGSRVSEGGNGPSDESHLGVVSDGGHLD